MRIQTSIEFISMLALVTVVALIGISQFKTSMTFAKNSIDVAYSMNVSALKSNMSYGSVRVFAAIQNATLLNYSYIAQIGVTGCDNGSVRAEYLGNGIRLKERNASFEFKYAATHPIQFTPITRGSDWINVSYFWKCENQSGSGLLSLNTFAYAENKNGYSQFLQAGYSNGDYFTIYSRKESEVFSLHSLGDATRFYIFSHCTYASMFGPTPIDRQCGTLNAWMYSVFSSNCQTTSNFYTETYCILPKDSGYNYGIVDQFSGISNYSFALHLHYSNKDYTANVTGRGNSAKFTGNLPGKPSMNYSASSVSVGNVAYSRNTSSGNERIANYSLLLNYMQHGSSVLDMLSYYNNSFLIPQEQQALQEQLLAYSNAMSAFLNSSGENGKCTVQNASYSCASPQIDYIIVDNASGNAENLSYAGSLMRLG